MYIIEKKLKSFSSAHRLINGYVGKCQSLHGHDYALNIKIASEILDDLGFVMEFSAIKSIFDKWIKDNIDHATLAIESDHSLIEFLKKQKQKYYILPAVSNSTAENIAQHIFHEFNKLIKRQSDLISRGVHIVSIQLWETKNACVIYENAIGT